MIQPPPAVILDAESAARRSPCAKSKRGAAIYAPRHSYRTLATGHNGPPGAMSCTGSDACRAACGRRCAHAERRALDEILVSFGVASGTGDGLGPSGAAHLDIVHVKIGPDSRVVAGGPPSCAQCAVSILDVGIGGVWLCELGTPPEELAVAARDGIAVLMRPFWRRYTGEEFYRVTCHNRGLEV